MESTLSTKRKASQTTPSLDPKDLLAAMAYDLKISQDPAYIDLYSLLSNGKYVSFLKKLDEMSTQLYWTDADLERDRRLHQLTALLSKYPFLDETIDRRKTALDKFRKSEHRCRRMNQKFRLRRHRAEPPHMQHMRDYIMRVLGAMPNMKQIYSRCDFGPGSSVGVSGNDVSVLAKLENLTVTPSALTVATVALMHNVHYSSKLMSGNIFCYDFADYISSLKYTEVQYNKIVCVPKNAKTERTIAIEPSLNGFIQKGIDLAIRDRLFRVGIDLNSQVRNQQLARLGSIDGSYATIDLSSASDSISKELVRELLPPEWFLLLNTTRSPAYRLDDEERVYEKFCSMGNGFCFPLQTLIFSAACDYAISRSYCARNFSVYGDDIIVPQGAALLLLEVLRDIGFRHNEDKTFIVGPFRESCGADWFLGENVRPLYVKDPIKLDHNAYYLLNRFREMNFSRSWNTLYERIPPRLRYVRPYPREDDSAITVPLDLFMSSRYARWSHALQTWTWKGVISKPGRGRRPTSVQDLEIGIFRGDLRSSDTFSARYSERTRVIVKT